MIEFKGELINIGFHSEATAFSVFGVAGDCDPSLLFKVLNSLIDRATVFDPGSLL